MVNWVDWTYLTGQLNYLLPYNIVCLPGQHGNNNNGYYDKLISKVFSLDAMTDHVP
jgi:hypothetical protein